MKFEDLFSFCEFLNCEISLGNPDTGFIQIDGSGLKTRSYTYGRFNMLNEVAHLASPRKALEQATAFILRRGNTERTLSRGEFVQELGRFQRLVSR